VTCSGTYPWVPDDVRDAILSSIARALKADGVALLHLITKPGCIATEEAQRRVLAQVGSLPTMNERLEAARAYVRTLPPIDKENKSQSMESLVRENLEQFLTRFDPGLPHEYLGSQIRSVFFSEFVERVRGFGLHAVSDASYSATCGRYFSSDVTHAVFERTRDWAKRQELIDMFGGNGGGRSVMLRKSARPDEASVPLVANFDEVGFYAFGDEAPKVVNGHIEWGDKNKTSISENATILLQRLIERYPHPMRGSELQNAISDANARNEALNDLAALGYVGATIEMAMARRPEARGPLAWALPRVEVSLGLPSLTSVLAWALPPDPQMAKAIELADGSRAQSECEAAVVAWLESDEFVETEKSKEHWCAWWPRFDRDGKKLEPPARREVGKIYERLARLGYVF
jgi:hypothetical protein